MHGPTVPTAPTSSSGTPASIFAKGKLPVQSMVSNKPESAKHSARILKKKVVCSAHDSPVNQDLVRRTEAPAEGTATSKPTPE